MKECAKVAATLQAKVKQVEGPDADDDDSIAAGVGFGPNFYKLVSRVKACGHVYLSNLLNGIGSACQLL